MGWCISGCTGRCWSKSYWRGCFGVGCWCRGCCTSCGRNWTYSIRGPCLEVGVRAGVEACIVDGIGVRIGASGGAGLELAVEVGIGAGGCPSVTIGVLQQSPTWGSLLFAPHTALTPGLTTVSSLCRVSPNITWDPTVLHEKEKSHR